ncbi:MAG: hypothetical protein IPP66_20290 [Anaerolineales bacterium]|jgi:transketolase|nr:hypothetical protein [Anaerolineales bacterium]
MTEYEKKWKEHIPEETREHYKKAREEFKKSVEGLMPEGFVEHHRNARREMMLAMRSMLDHAIKKMDEKA